MTDTTLTKLPIGKCKKESLATIAPEENEILFVNPQFAGNQVLITTPDGDIVEATSLTGYTATGTITLKCVNGVLQWVAE